MTKINRFNNFLNKLADLFYAVWVDSEGGVWSEKFKDLDRENRDRYRQYAKHAIRIFKCYFRCKNCRWWGELPEHLSALGDDFGICGNIKSKMYITGDPIGKNWSCPCFEPPKEAKHEAGKG